ncbi:MAG TPA: D-glycero-beta-D-manno-heptose 1-phosphate adenylyltransferase, partial [Rhodospirillales bacterium]|nr:D-glycero-beta-D-manno-heptose 1-phosphate adenylyltransferase [Rhodospirillales bacterium]
AKGVLLGARAAALVEALAAQGARAVVDPKGPDFTRYRGAAVVTPNRRELALAAGAPVLPGEEADAARALRGSCGLGAVLVTLGGDGMLLIDADDAALALPAEAREVFDVSGAGDTVVAALAAALAAGALLPEAAALANTAAGIVVGKVGTAVVRPSELADAARRRALLGCEGKVCDVAAAAERVAVWRRQGLRVGFTNGCFDLIHPGHVSLLAQAKAACDRLIVGLNTDASVARLKGAGRPVQAEAARATVLASLAAVDAVVPFAEDTPLPLILALRPDVLVKGADYRLEQVVGAEEVRGWGGRVVLARLEPGFSTTATVAALNS